MKLFNDQIIFDEIPSSYEHSSKIFLSHLQPLLKYVNYKYHLPLFFTTKAIARRLLAYYKVKNSKILTWRNFILLKPYKECILTLQNKERICVMTCASDDPGLNAMYLIRRDKTVLHCYAGNFADIRTAMMYDNFASWISNGVANLYINAMNADLTDEVNGEKNLIDEIYGYLKIPTLNHIYIIVGDLGFERFIGLLGKWFSGRVFLDHFLPEVYSPKQLQSMKHFTQQIETSKIVVTTKEMSELYKENQKEKEYNIFIELIENKALYSNRDFYLQRQYLPFPNNIELGALISLLNAKWPYGINSEGEPTNLPMHLQCINPVKEICILGKAPQAVEQHQIQESQGRSQINEYQKHKKQKKQSSGYVKRNVHTRNARGLNYVDDSSSSD